MALDNTITVSGNVTRDPELRHTPSGKPVANLAVAVNRKWTNQTTGVAEEHVTFIDVTAWGNLGLNVAESVNKGNRLIITGRLDQHSWETPEGENRHKHQIIADDIAPSLRWAKTSITKTIRETGPTQPTSTTGLPQPVPNQTEEEPF